MGSLVSVSSRMSALKKKKIFLTALCFDPEEPPVKFGENPSNSLGGVLKLNFVFYTRLLEWIMVSLFSVNTRAQERKIENLFLPDLRIDATEAPVKFGENPSNCLGRVFKLDFVFYACSCAPIFSKI